MNSPTAPGRLEGLQALRFVAAAGVMWAHVKFVLPPTGHPAVTTALGSIGVDVFFVISGFVIALTASRLQGDHRRFFAHRIARIVPAYYLLSSLFLIYSVVQHGDGGDGRRLWNSVLFLPLFDTGNFTMPWHDFGWTLSFEMWFYLVFGGLLAQGGAERARVWLPAALAAGTVLVFPCWHGAWFFPRFAFHPLVLEFSAGCLLFHFRGWLARIGPVLLLAWPVFAIGAVMTERLGWHMAVLADPALGWSRAAVWGGFAVCTVGAVAWWDGWRRRPLPRWATLLGDASYSLYLVQLFPLHLLRRLNPGGSALGAVVFVVASVLGGLAFHLAVEKPMTVRAKAALERWFAAAPGRTGPA